jgi:hypothetical protein
MYAEIYMPIYGEVADDSLTVHLLFRVAQSMAYVIFPDKYLYTEHSYQLPRSEQLMGEANTLGNIRRAYTSIALPFFLYLNSIKFQTKPKMYIKRAAQSFTHDYNI